MNNGHHGDDVSVARREFLLQSRSIGLGAMALGFLERASQASEVQAPASVQHHAPRAKNVIFLTQSGGPSQIELFDEKPNLASWAGKELPESVRQGQRLTTMTANQKQLVMPARTRFKQYGESGATIGEWLPHHAQVVDDLCFVKSMVTDQINHAPAMTKFLTGHQLPGRPSLGAWTSYGLGSENQNLPEYLVLISKMKRPSDQPLYDHYWGSGFLPSRYQGVKFRNAKEPVLYLRDPDGLPRHLRRGMLDGLSELNELQSERAGDPEIATRIRQYEMAWRMQTSIPELTDLSDEPESTFELYGPDSRRPGSYAANCVLARRLVERGVRFVQLFHPDWDHHSRLSSWCVARCRDTDQASAALVTDLKQRGLLDETLVLWGGEFGRQPVAEYAEGTGRDHCSAGFTMWMAGGGIKGGVSVGETDELGSAAVQDRFHVKNLHATILNQLGFDANELSYFHAGLGKRLVGVEGASPISQVIA